MAKFRENLKVESLTQAEILVKSAMKNHEMHEKAVNIITAAMDKIMNQERQETALREVNVDTFLMQMNNELLSSDP